jgi:hypothetical protein
MGLGLWKLEISNNRSGPGFLNVSEQWVQGRSWGFNAFEGMYTISGFYQNPTQYPIEFFKLFRFFDKNPHEHS